MIEIHGDIVKIDTLNSSLLLRISDIAEIVYYGKKIYWEEDYSFLGNYGYKNKFSSADDVDATPCTFSFCGDGTNRENMIHVVADGVASLRFKVDKFYLSNQKPYTGVLPFARNAEQFLIIEYYDAYSDVRVTQYFGVFCDSDVICTGLILSNGKKRDVFIRRFMSLQLDFVDADYKVLSLRGEWCAEANATETELLRGTYSSSSVMGLSSNSVNPYFAVEKNTDEPFVVAINTLYSGNHKEIVQKTSLSGVRVLAGINDYLMNYRVEKGREFYSPQSIFTFGNSRKETAESFRNFVVNHIVDPIFSRKPRPVIINSWEGFAFSFNEEKMQSLCKAAKDVGCEVFVIDDGWFGKRNDDKSSLGDWFENESKFNGGLKKLADNIKASGMGFGIWIEPEMISADSELYRAHPDYAMTIDGVEPIEIRHQLMLDITKPEVKEYIVNAITEIINKYNVDYIKWDCNRGITEIKNADNYYYDYTLSLYEILYRVRTAFPYVFIESCASGGNRFDLGMLFYTPQIWASDNTDPIKRLFTQEGLLNAYPQSVISAHVPSEMNCHSLKSYPLNIRLAVSAMTSFGYELDMTVLSKEDLCKIEKFNDIYKEYREILNFGDFYITETVTKNKRAVYVIVSEDQEKALVFVFDLENSFLKIPQRIILKGLNDDFDYTVVSAFNPDEKYFASGKTLNNVGFFAGKLFDMTEVEKYSGTLSSKMFIVQRKARGTK